MTSFSFTIFR
uniref:Cyclin-dependent kinase F-4 n=1 Tax=Rhizophora mucronata TaxID=61149 RepID=A0A2P2P0M2_RHIMU